jgi:hypothetical protein
LFTFPHPSPKEVSVGVNSPWVEDRIEDNWGCSQLQNYTLGGTR